MSEPILDVGDALLFLNMESATAYEYRQLEYLLEMITATIISYCGQDPRQDPEHDCRVLPFVAGRLLLQLYPQIRDETTGIQEQTFKDFSVKMSDDTGIDKLSQQLLSRFRKLSIF